MIKTMKKKVAKKKVSKSVLKRKAVQNKQDSVENTFSFGKAIKYAKAGYKVARKGWNGKGMGVIYIPGTKKAELREGTPYKAVLGKRKYIEILPHFDMYTVNASGRKAMLPGWLASQSDLDSLDWCIVK